MRTNYHPWRLAPLLLGLWLVACVTPSGPQPAHHPSLLGAALPGIVPSWAILRANLEQRRNYKLSPDGTRIAWTALEGRFFALHIQSLEGGPVAVVAGKDFAISTYYWAEDSRHLFVTKDTDGSENDRLLVVDADHPEAEPQDLAADPQKPSKTILDAVPTNRPDIVYVLSNERQESRLDLYAVDVVAGRKRLIAEDDGRISTWIIDRDGVVRARQRGRSMELHHADGDSWGQAFDSGADDHLHMLSQLGTDSWIWARSNRGRDRAALVRLDLASGAEEEVYADPDSDLDAVAIDPGRNVPLMAEAWPDRQRLKIFDPVLERQLAPLRADPDASLHIVSADRAGEKLVLRLDGADGSSEFHLLDRKSGALKRLVRNEGALWRERISPTEPVSFAARDGLVLHGFLTLPRGAPAQRLPMVLLVHGGPWDQDRWGFDQTTQFLANRGYVVLRVNYRGSLGYGRAFETAGKGEIGGKMQQDLVDAVAWAIDRGTADPKSIAIMGGSYGGYAALQGLTSTPELFAAGIEVNGPADLLSLARNLPPYWPVGRWFAYLGDPHSAADRKTMTERSPLSHVDRIARPLLAFQSANDVRIKRDQFDHLVAAMRRAGKDVEPVVFVNEGHSPRLAEDNHTLYDATERFLARHLGGRTGP